MKEALRFFWNGFLIRIGIVGLLWVYFVFGMLNPELVVRKLKAGL